MYNINVIPIDEHNKIDNDQLIEYFLENNYVSDRHYHIYNQYVIIISDNFSTDINVWQINKSNLDDLLISKKYNIIINNSIKDFFRNIKIKKIRGY